MWAFIKKGGFMSDPDDVIKLNMGDLFGDDLGSELHPAKESFQSATHTQSEEISHEGDIKFNDLTNKPSVAPMVRMQKKGMRGVVLDLGMGQTQPTSSVSEPSGQVRSGLNPEKPSRQLIEGESSFKLIQRGKSS